jgi:hypothetical protein
MRACLVSGLTHRLRDAAPGRLRNGRLVVVRAVMGEALFGLDLGLVMGSSEADATLAAASPQPYLGKTPGRAGPEGVRKAPGITHSNAPFRVKRQSFPSNIVAHGLSWMRSEV